MNKTIQFGIKKVGTNRGKNFKMQLYSAVKSSITLWHQMDFIVSLLCLWINPIKLKRPRFPCFSVSSAKNLNNLNNIGFIVYLQTAGTICHLWGCSFYIRFSIFSWLLHFEIFPSIVSWMISSKHMLVWRMAWIHLSSSKELDCQTPTYNLFWILFRIFSTADQSDHSQSFSLGWNVLRYFIWRKKSSFGKITYWWLMNPAYWKSFLIAQAIGPE